MKRYRRADSRSSERQPSGDGSEADRRTGRAGSLINGHRISAPAAFGDATTTQPVRAARPAPRPSHSHPAPPHVRRIDHRRCGTDGPAPRTPRRPQRRIPEPRKVVAHMACRHGEPDQDAVVAGHDLGDRCDGIDERRLTPLVDELRDPLSDLAAEVIGVPQRHRVILQVGSLPGSIRDWPRSGSHPVCRRTAALALRASGAH